MKNLCFNCLGIKHLISGACFILTTMEKEHSNPQTDLLLQICMIILRTRKVEPVKWQDPGDKIFNISRSNATWLLSIKKFLNDLVFSKRQCFLGYKGGHTPKEISCKLNIGWNWFLY